jgi:selenocysteine lyase/cysteine desulfurase
MKATLEEIPGVDVVTPLDWGQSSGIVTFTISGLVGREVSSQLWNDHRIAQRSVEVPGAVRASCTYFTTEEDITRLAEAVDRLARGR